MKAFKIAIASIVIGLMVILIYKFIENIIPPPPPPDVKNVFVVRIEKEIDSLSKFPENKFCNDLYKEINYYIEEDFKNGHLGDTIVGNKERKKILSNNLYSVYTDKFIKQAYYVFNGTEWRPSDLNLIRDENKKLRNSEFLEKSSPIDSDLVKIQSILNKYDEITAFVSSCNKFSYSETSLSEGVFPIQDIRENIKRAKAYLQNNLENKYVNNCIRLKEGLKEIPEILFKAHIQYLENKIGSWTGMYSNYNSQRDYKINLYDLMKKEINTLDNDIYNVSKFQSERKRLIDKLDEDSNNAYDYFNN